MCILCIDGGIEPILRMAAVIAMEWANERRRVEGSKQEGKKERKLGTTVASSAAASAAAAAAAPGEDCRVWVCAVEVETESSPDNK